MMSVGWVRLALNSSSSSWPSCLCLPLTTVGRLLEKWWLATLRDNFKVHNFLCLLRGFYSINKNIVFLFTASPEVGLWAWSRQCTLSTCSGCLTLSNPFCRQEFSLSWLVSVAVGLSCCVFNWSFRFLTVHCLVGGNFFVTRSFVTFLCNRGFSSISFFKVSYFMCVHECHSVRESENSCGVGSPPRGPWGLNSGG